MQAPPKVRIRERVHELVLFAHGSVNGAVTKFTLMCSNGNVTEKRHRHRPNDLLMVTSSLGFDARPDAKDDGRIVYDLLYVCAGKFGGQVGGPGFCVGCRRSTRDLSGKTVVGWCNAIGGCSDRCTWDRKTPVHLCGMTLRITATMQQVFDKTRTITIKGSHEHDHQDQWHRSDEKPRQYLDGPAGCDFEVQRQTHHAQEGALYQQQAQQQMSVASQRGLVSPANVDSDLDQRLAVTQQPISAGAGLQSMSRPPSGGVGASGGAAVAAIMVGAGSGKRLREIESHHLEQPQQMPALDSPRKHSKRTGDSTGGLAEGPFQAHAQQKAVQLRLHHQHHQQQSQQHQHQQQQQQQLPREHCQPQQPAPSRKPRARAPKREFRDDVQQAIVDLPTITSQETSRRNHEEELQMQRTLRAKFLKSSAVNAERDEREKAQLASESLGTSPAWRTSVACMRVIAWLEAGEKLEQEMAAEEAKAGRSGMEGHGEGGMAGEDGIAGTSAFLARN